MKLFKKILLISALLLCFGNVKAQEDCDNPINVTSFPYSADNQATVGYTSDYGNTCLGAYDSGPDVIYKFTTTAARDIKITMNPDGQNYTGIALYDQCPISSEGCLYVVTGTTSTERVITANNLSANTYYIIVCNWQSDNPNGIESYDISIISGLAKINGAAVPGILKIQGISKSNIKKINGVEL